MSIRWRIHFSASFLLAIFMITGRFAEYAIVVVSLLVHEFGHLVAARIAGVRIESVCFYLHGADIRFMTNFIAPKQQMFVACGGPVATLILLAICLVGREGMLAEVIAMQKLLLFVNMCPVWPLDGGRILQAMIISFFKSAKGELLFLKFSFIVSIVAVIGAILFYVPVLGLLAAVICIQVATEIKQFPLQSAYKRLVLYEK